MVESDSVRLCAGSWNLTDKTAVSFIFREIVQNEFSVCKAVFILV